AFAGAPGGVSRGGAAPPGSGARVRDFSKTPGVGPSLTDDADGRIDGIIDRFRRRGVHFMWLVRPPAQPPDLAARLARRGLSLVEHGTGMSLDVDDLLLPAPSDASAV